MSQIIAATFENGVFKPEQKPDLAEKTRVRLHVETVQEGTDKAVREQSWASLEKLWQISTFNSHGDRLSRDQLHERR